jgi:hypothetical protein
MSALRYGDTGVMERPSVDAGLIVGCAVPLLLWFVAYTVFAWKMRAAPAKDFREHGIVTFDDEGPKGLHVDDGSDDDAASLAAKRRRQHDDTVQKLVVPLLERAAHTELPPSKLLDLVEGSPIRMDVSQLRMADSPLASPIAHVQDRSTIVMDRPAAFALHDVLQRLHAGGRPYNGPAGDTAALPHGVEMSPRGVDAQRFEPPPLTNPFARLNDARQRDELERRRREEAERINWGVDPLQLHQQQRQQRSPRGEDGTGGGLRSPFGDSRGTSFL